MAFDLTGKRALFVGASDRLGVAIAQALKDAGARVVVDHELDVTSSAAVDAAVANAGSQLGGLDVVVGNPDAVLGKPAIETTDQEWERVLRVNLSGAFFLARAAGAAMLESGGGRLINVVNLLADRGMANSAAYCAAKAGVLNMTRALSAEWARRGICVNALCTGFLEGSPYESDRGQLERYMPMRRLGLPEEVAPAVVYLASDESAFMTGQVLALEGGAFSHI
jgi:NAD(P)-dependent dehydrogenase (short-subunit alcohol dehydrogenase family)